MGCLPVILLFIIGSGAGWWLAGQAGALWGAGIGIVAGVLAGLVLLAIVHHLRASADKS